MKPQLFTLAVTAVGLGSSLFAQSGRGPSTPEERQRVVGVVRSLEANPLASGAQRDRQWLTLWLVAVPDIKVSLCTEFFPELLGSKKNHASELLMQSPYSMAAFVIEHPERAEDAEAKYDAAVQGTLRAYGAILQRDPKARWAVLDGLLTKRDKGELPEFIHATAPRCNSK